MRLLVIVLFAALLVSCGAGPAPVAAEIHARAEDGSVITPVNLFAQYEPRGRILGTVPDGARVSLISIVGNGALVETQSGLRGWCNKAFVRRL